MQPLRWYYCDSRSQTSGGYLGEPTCSSMKSMSRLPTRATPACVTSTYISRDRHCGHRHGACCGPHDPNTRRRCCTALMSGANLGDEVVREHFKECSVGRGRNCVLLLPLLLPLLATLLLLMYCAMQQRGCMAGVRITAELQVSADCWLSDRVYS